MYNHFITV